MNEEIIYEFKDKYDEHFTIIENNKYFIITSTEDGIVVSFYMPKNEFHNFIGCVKPAVGL